jgi:CheY-like chemotaxis protein
VDTPLAGLRVFVLEDESPVAMLIEDMLRDLDCEIAAEAARVHDALRTIEAGPTFDVALLDVNVAGEKAFPVADALRARGVPFAFLTGYGSVGLREDLRDSPVLAKPFRRRDLERVLRELRAAT